jgi:hypothetical protein
MGEANTTTLDRFGHNQSGGEQLVHTMHTSRHAVRQVYGEGQLGWAGSQRTGLPRRAAFLRLRPRWAVCPVRKFNSPRNPPGPYRATTDSGSSPVPGLTISIHPDSTRIKS